MRFPSSLLPLLAVLGLGLTGCRDREVATYRVSREKETAPPMAAPADAAAPMAGGQNAMANTPVATAQGADLSWTAPAHWQAKPGSAMRKGSYSVPADGAAADLSITAFPGDVGGETANLNRWRGQLSLPAADEAALASALTRFEQGGLKFTVVDFDNGQQRLLGAIVPLRGNTWFFKLMGPAAPLAKEKAAFLDFLQTVKAPAAP